jgi:tripartite-type tricarboxylate transporter receptor subunit TctC
VPSPAGGGSDVTARIVAGPIAKELGAEVVVENVAGASGGIAIQKVMAAPADGRIIYQGSQSELIIPPLTIKSVKHKPADLEIVHPITTTRLVLVVRKNLPANNLQEFVALARQRSASEPLSYGSSGIGSLYHLIPEAMAKLAHVTLNHIPYKGAAPMMQDLIGDRVDFTVMAYSTTMNASVQAGHYRIIANMSKDKPKELVQLPSISDLDMFKTVDYASNAGYFVRKGTPSAIKLQLNRAIGGAMSTPAVYNALEADGRLVHRRMSLEDAEAYYRSEVAKYERVITQTGFQPLD